MGGELEPSARGHAGAGNFSDQATLLRLTGSEVSLETESEGPRARGWSAGGVWRSGESGERMLVVAGLTGDDNNPVRLMDVWMGQM